MKITVNGTDYDSWDDVPEQLRSLLGSTLPDADGDGVPDLLQGTGVLPADGVHVQSTSIDVDGRTYDSIDDLPAGIRASLQSAGLLGGPPAPSAQAANPAGRLPAASTPARPAGRQPLGPGQVLLNGEVVDVDPGPERRRWWQRR